MKIANHCHYFKRQAADLLATIKSQPVAFDGSLTLEDDGIALCSEIDGQTTCFTHSFRNPALLRRAAQKNQLLLKACGGRNRTGETRLIDLTAGWGRDGFVLASHGFKVCMVEQNPLVFACLRFLLDTAAGEPPLAALDHLSLEHNRGIDFLASLQPGIADCLYLDPMFEDHRKSAKPAKDLQILQRLTENQDIEATFEQALQKQARRVVVKRPLHAESLAGVKPDVQQREKTVRFDIYLGAGRSQPDAD